MQPRCFTPALRFRALTPWFDRSVAMLGFGDSFLREVERLLDIQPGQRLLDAGCGTGRLLPYLARVPGTGVTGVDIDHEALALAKQKFGRLENVEIIEASITSLPLQEGSVDAVVSVLTFHHLEPEAKGEALREIRRILRPTGRLLLVDIGAPENFVQRLLLEAGSWAEGRRKVLPHIRGDIPGMVAGAGYSLHELRDGYRSVRFLECRPTD